MTIQLPVMPITGYSPRELRQDIKELEEDILAIQKAVQAYKRNYISSTDLEWTIKYLTADLEATKEQLRVVTN